MQLQLFELEGALPEHIELETVTPSLRRQVTVRDWVAQLEQEEGDQAPVS